jgi:hypothetical protein
LRWHAEGSTRGGHVERPIVDGEAFGERADPARARAGGPASRSATDHTDGIRRRPSASVRSVGDVDGSVVRTSDRQRGRSSPLAITARAAWTSRGRRGRPLPRRRARGRCRRARRRAALEPSATMRRGARPIQAQHVAARMVGDPHAAVGVHRDAAKVTEPAGPHFDRRRSGEGESGRGRRRL